jgi:hypothetical protein
MATGGLLTCTACKRPVRDGDWLRGKCGNCGCDFGRIDPDFLAKAIQRQQRERDLKGLTPGYRALLLGSGITMSWAVLLMLIQREFSALPGWTMHQQWTTATRMLGYAIGPGIVGAFAAWMVARHGQRERWDSSSTWTVAALVGFMAPPTLFFMIMFFFQFIAAISAQPVH